MLLLKAHTAQANDWANDMTVCRLVKCMKLDKAQEVCVYRGAHNTQETLFFKYGEWKPREYPASGIDQPPPPNVYDVLKAIFREPVDGSNNGTLFWRGRFCRV